MLNISRIVRCRSNSSRSRLGAIAVLAAFFLIVMPLLGIFEKTKPVPNSISDSVLGAKG